METPADAEIVDDNNFILKRDGRIMNLSIDALVEVKAGTWDNTPMHDYDAENKGTMRVVYTAVILAKYSVAIKVTLSPHPN